VNHSSFYVRFLKAIDPFRLTDVPLGLSFARRIELQARPASSLFLLLLRSDVGFNKEQVVNTEQLILSIGVAMFRAQVEENSGGTPVPTGRQTLQS
jgi:hypothetical protein